MQKVKSRFTAKLSTVTYTTLAIAVSSVGVMRWHQSRQVDIDNKIDGLQKSGYWEVYPYDLPQVRRACEEGGLGKPGTPVVAEFPDGRVMFFCDESPKPEQKKMNLDPSIQYARK